MARVVAAHLSGEAAAFTGADMSTKLKLLGVDVASFGDAHGRTPGCLSYQWTDGPAQIYKKIVVSEDGKQLLGGVLVGKPATMRRCCKPCSTGWRCQHNRKA
jgi:nitrite reductase (NADH) large subunit